MHLGPSKIKILTKYGALGPLNKGLNEEINFPQKILKFEQKNFKKHLVLYWVWQLEFHSSTFERKIKKSFASVVGMTVGIPVGQYRATN